MKIKKLKYVFSAFISLCFFVFNVSFWQYEPNLPIITTNPEWEGGVAHVVIQYTDAASAVDHRDRNAPVFHVSVWTIDNLNVNESNMSVSFDVKDIWNDVRSLDVSVWEWLIIFDWNILSLWNSNTFSYEVDCQNLPDGSWNCLLWYKNVSNCCVLACEGSGYLSGVVDWQYICESCIPGETIPNESHTRCICDPNFKCCWVQLNNVIPFIWDCIEMNAESSRDNTTNVNSVTAFPILMQWLMKILMSVIMIFSFLMIIVAWLMIVSWAFGWNWFTTGKKIIKNVIISLILLWCSWLILSLINPSFFGG